MLISTLLVVFLTFICLLLLITRGGAALRRRPEHQNGKKLLPGPKPLPIIGNLHMLFGDLPHRALAKLAQKYGPIMSIKLGQVPTVVVSSPRYAELILKTHDVVFASRPKTQASEIMFYGAKGMALTPYGSYWWNVRKMCTMELFSSSKIETFASMRREEVGLLVEEIKKAAAAREAVDLTMKVDQLVENNTYKMIFGKYRDEEFDVMGFAAELMALLNAFNLSDYFPFLAPFDLQGLTKRMKTVQKSADKLLEKIIYEHEKDYHQQKDFVDMLLSMLNQPMNPTDVHKHVIGMTNVKAILLDMFVAALDSSSTVIGWTLSELLKHPRIMTRLQDELERVIGKNRLVEEKDLVNLPYLDMVVNEILRLNLVAPFLLPRESMEDITVDGFYVPKKTRILVNVWAIGHDPNIWSENAEEFFPERFDGSNLDVKGQHFQLIPFGTGRRGCPGMPLGLTNVKYVVAQLMHCFDWILPDGMSPSEHLFAMPTYRLHV